MSTDPRQSAGYVKEMQVARGLGILLVTFGHSEPVAKVFPTLWDVIYSFHMPLFFFMSGFFSTGFIKRPWFRDILPRVSKLYIPYIVISLSFALIKLYAPNVKRPVVAEELLNDILFYPFSNPALFLWFLYILLLMKLLSPLFRGRGPMLLLPIFLVTACWPGSIDLFGTWGLLKYFLYYTCGLMLAGHSTLFLSKLKEPMLRVLSLFLFSVCCYFSLKRDMGPLQVLTALMGIWLILSLSSCALPARMSRLLEICGKLSLEIYLLQYFFIFPTLFVLSRVGVDQRIIVLCTFIAGLAGPVMTKKYVLEKNGPLSLLLSGRK